MLWEWGTAIIASSLLGSGHCVGMCGPFAVLATSGRSNSTSWTYQVTSLVSYHLGRLATYVVLGAMMGGLGSVADGLAIGSGWTPIAARWVGGLMVLIGVALLVKWCRGHRGLVQHSGWVARWNQWILHVRKGWRVRSAVGVAFSWGLISTWLPCGWLYVFAIAAAGAGGVVWGMLLMTAFWVGTLPLLSMVSIGAWWLSRRAMAIPPAVDRAPHFEPIACSAKFARWVTSAQPFVQPVAACMLIAFGVLTATSRAEISLSRLKVSSSSPTQSSQSEQLKELIDQPLPCCQVDDSSSDLEESQRGDDK